jgi:hypothetical protein
VHFLFFWTATTKVPGRRKLVFGDSSTQSMVIPVVEFQAGDKIGKICLLKDQQTQKEIIEF